VKQVESTLGRAVQTILARGLSDPRIRGMVTVTSVTVSRDLHQAELLISIYPKEHEDLTMRGLQQATMRIQRLVNEQLHMRRPPKIRFTLDTQLKRQAEVLSAISEAMEDVDLDRPIDPEGEFPLEEDGGGEDRG